MAENGKLHDVLIEDILSTDERTGVQSFGQWIIVWADIGKLEIIKSVEGVVSAYNHEKDSKYDVRLDPRYSREYVKAEIEAALLCGDK